MSGKTGIYPTEKLLQLIGLSNFYFMQLEYHDFQDMSRWFQIGCNDYSRGTSPLSSHMKWTYKEAVVSFNLPRFESMRQSVKLASLALSLPSHIINYTVSIKLHFILKMALFLKDIKAGEISIKRNKQFPSTKGDGTIELWTTKNFTLHSRIVETERPTTYVAQL